MNFQFETRGTGNASDEFRSMSAGARPEPAYKIAVNEAETAGDRVTLAIGFGREADNDAIVPEAIAAAKSIATSGQLYGQHVQLNGRASLPVGLALAHELSHVVRSLSVFDPKTNAYIPAVSADPEVKVGRAGEAEGEAYRIAVARDVGGMLVLKVGFARPEIDNNVVVHDALKALQPIVDSGVSQRKLVVLHGPASLPVAVALGQRLAHVCDAVAAFDTKLAKAVVGIAHGERYKAGQLVDVQLD